MIAEILIVPSKDAPDAVKSGAQYIARCLGSDGLKVRENVSLCTGRRKLGQAVSSALDRSDVVIILGGMGKESGYLSRSVVAGGLGLSLVRDESCLDAVRAYCARSGEPFSADDENCADMPEGAQAFAPAYGKSPGCAVSSASQHIIMLPEAPQELAEMWGRYVSPYLGGTPSALSVTHIIRTYGAGEDYVREKLGNLTATVNPSVTVHRDGNELAIRVSAHGTQTRDAAMLCAPVLREAARRLGDLAYGLDVDSIQSAVAIKLAKKGLGLAVAESGTGGMLTRIIGEAGGGTDILRYSAYTDDDEKKITKLDLSPKLLKKRGGISEYAAVAMAEGARKRAGCDIGAAIAANVNDFEDRRTDPGLVYIAVCDGNYVYVKKLVVGTGNADEDVITDAAISRALNMIRLFVDYLPGHYKGCVPLESALWGKRAVTERDSYDEDCESAPYSVRKTVADRLLIRKADEPKVKVRKLLFMLAVLVFAGCAGYLSYYYYDSMTAQNRHRHLQSLYEEPSPDEPGAVDEDFPAQFSSRFGQLWSVNNDTVGYISVEGTQIGYPVVQAPDNEYYLRRDFHKNESRHGIPFMDYRVEIGRPSDNFVIYGHNMEDGRIFGELINYKRLGYLTEHPVIQFDTLYEESGFIVFAVFLADVGEFPYHDFINASSSRDFRNYVEELKYRSILDTGVDVSYGDTLLTLSTCSTDFKDARFVIAARKLRGDEDPDALISGAAENPSPLYPDAWYSLYGGEPPDVPKNASIAPSMTSAGVPPQDQGPDPEERPAVMSYVAGASAPSSQLPPLITHAEIEAAKAAEQEAAEQAEREAAEKAAQEAEAQRLELLVKQLEADGAAAAANAASSAEKAEIAADAAESSTGVQQAEKHMETAYTSARQAQAHAQSAVDIAAQAKTDTAASMATAAKVSLENAADAYYRASAAVAKLIEEENLRIASEAANNSAPPASTQDPGNLTVTEIGAGKITGSTLDIISRIVQVEIGSAFHDEAIKAQAVAAYSFLLYESAGGKIPSVYLAPSVSDKVRQNVAAVLGQKVTYGGKVAFTPYHAASAGVTTSSRDVWGGSYPYLVSVDSSIETSHNTHRVSVSMSRKDVEERISSRLGITPAGNPANWFEVLSYTDGDYIGQMAVFGETRSARGTTLTGRIIREQVLNLRSAAFETDYNSAADTFTFTTYGYGHGVGMSQIGANMYAQQGRGYADILAHYYPGTSLRQD